MTSGGPARVLVTGASGFVGGALAARLASRPGMQCTGAVRRAEAVLPHGIEPVLVGDLSATASWTDAVRGVDVVVHAAARVHVMRDRAGDPLSEFRRVNLDGTLYLARQAAAAGVRRFVFLSSIKVNGEGTSPGRPYRADDAPAPVDPYGVSKLEAEQRLNELARETGLEVVVVRPVLVYGPGVKGNFLTMMRWLRRGVPLPLGALHNRRSLLSVENLVDLLERCLYHPQAAGGTFLASDGEDLSTTALLKRTAAAMGRPARLLPVPATLLETLARALGRDTVAQRLCSSLQVDDTATRERLGWTPPLDVEEGLRRTVAHFLENEA